MKPDNIEQKLEQLADVIGSRDCFVNDVISKIENSPMQSNTFSTNNVPMVLQLKNNIDQWMRVAAAIAIVCCGGLGVLITFLVRTNALASSMAFMTSCINSLSYVGGLLL